MVNNKELELVRPQTVQEQVYRHLRERFATGEWAAGAKLPSTLELAGRWGTQPALVHQAMTRLVKEGYLMRRRGLGTFVRERARHLTCLGIYYPGDIWSNVEQHFFRILHGLLQAELGQRKITLKTWIDSRPRKKQASALPELADALTRRELDGLIVPFATPEHLPWFHRLPAPVALMTSAPLPNRVTFDAPQLARLSMEQLAAGGCKSAGLISMTPASAVNPDGSKHEYLKFLEQFMQTAADLGITLKDDWIRLPQPPHEWDIGSHEQFGYRQVNELLALSERPEGLVIDPDSVARGAILGLLEKQVRIPQEMKLLVHRNKGIDLLCPVPAIFIESDPREVAGALIQLIDRQFRGEKPEPIILSYRVVSQTKGI